jgi:hypothetical protein
VQHDKSSWPAVPLLLPAIRAISFSPPLLRLMVLHEKIPNQAPAAPVGGYIQPL